MEFWGLIGTLAGIIVTIAIVGISLAAMLRGIRQELRADLKELKADFKELKEDVARVGSKVSKLRRKVRGIEVKVDALWTQFWHGPPVVSKPAPLTRPAAKGVVEPPGEEPAVRVAATHYISKYGPSLDGKYGPLAAHLLEFPGDSHMVTFAELDEMLDGGLPASARSNRQWWENSFSHVQAAAWLSAGWEVAHMGVDFDNEKVLFQKIKSR